MIWSLSNRADPPAVAIADRHYNRQKPGTPQFVPPGSCLVLLAPEAVWVTSWPKAEYVRHRWAGAWVNSCFRREGGVMRASDMIREAVAATRAFYGEPPTEGIVTFVDASKVRHKRDPGRCYLRAGFRRVGTTMGGLVALQLLPDSMPAPEPALGSQLTFDRKGADPAEWPDDLRVQEIPDDPRRTPRPRARACRRDRGAVGIPARLPARGL